MRTQAVILTVVACGVLLTTVAHGREMAGKIGITPQFGLVIPASDYADGQGIGSTHGLELEYFYTNNLSLGLRLFYDRFAGAGSFSNDDDDDIWPIYGLGGQAKYYRAASRLTDVFGRLSFVLCRMELPIHQSIWAFDRTSTGEMATSTGMEAGFGITRHLSRRLSFSSEIEYSLLFTRGIRIEKEPSTLWHNYNCSYNTQTVAVKLGLTFYFGGR